MPCLHTSFLGETGRKHEYRNLVVDVRYEYFSINVLERKIMKLEQALMFIVENIVSVTENIYSHAIVIN